MLTAVELLLVWVRQALDNLIALLGAFRLDLLALEDAVLLPLHPLNVLDLLALHLVVVAGLPVVLALLVLLAVEGSKFLVDGVDLVADLVSLSPSLVLLGVGLLELFSNLLHLVVEDFLFILDLLNLVPNRVFLFFQPNDLLVNFLVSFDFVDGAFEDVDVFDQSGFCLPAHRRGRQTPLAVFDLLVHSLDCEAVRVHALQELAFLLLNAAYLVNDVAHGVLVCSLISAYALGRVDFLRELALASVATLSVHTALTYLPPLLD